MVNSISYSIYLIGAKNSGKSTIFDNLCQIILSDYLLSDNFTFSEFRLFDSKKEDKIFDKICYFVVNSKLENKNVEIQ